jgi:uracil-DNA glycosylase
VGSIHTALMFVGEAPGADEDEQGEPFVGAAGQLLTKIIQTMGYSRDTVYIANILKCRPDMPAQATGNRKPTSDEMKTCLPYLLEQVDGGRFVWKGNQHHETAGQLADVSEHSRDAHVSSRVFAP